MNKNVDSNSGSGLKFFVGGVPNEVKRRELLSYFRQFGVVKRITNFNPNHGKKLFGFCFIKFDSLFSDDLYDKSKQFSFLGRNLEIDPIIRRSCLKKRVEERHSKRIFLPELPSELKSEDLLRVFSCFGKITNCFIVERKDKRTLDALSPTPSEEGKDRDSTFTKMNYGFVIFEEQQIASKLISVGRVRVDGYLELEIKRYSPGSTKEPFVDEIEIRERKSSKEAEPARQTIRSKGISEEAYDISVPKTVFSGMHYCKPTQKTYFTQQKLNTQELMACANSFANVRFNLQACTTPF